MKAPAMLPSAARAAGYAWFPKALLAALAIVIAVNVTMVWFATRSFPGQVNANPYEVGTEYNHILAAAQTQAALGWRLTAEADGRTLSVRLADRTGQPIAGADVRGTLSRPVGPPQTTEVRLVPAAPGQYRAADILAAPGQWELDVDATRGNERLSTSIRVVAR
jgi:nitrogen fixation protein FixH